MLILQGHQNSVISVAHSPAALLFATGSGISSAAPPPALCLRHSLLPPPFRPLRNNERYLAPHGVIERIHMSEGCGGVPGHEHAKNTHERVDSTIQATSVHGFGATASSRRDERVELGQAHEEDGRGESQRSRARHCPLRLCNSLQRRNDQPTRMSLIWVLSELRRCRVRIGVCGCRVPEETL